MHHIFPLIGPDHTLQIVGVKLLGVNATNGRKLLLTIAFFLILYLLSKGLRLLARAGGSREKVAFWTGQGISIVSVILAGVGFVSIWFDNPARLATGAGLVGAGLAFALQ